MEELFKPIQIGQVHIKNRIAMAPIGTQFANLYGTITDQNICFYTARAKGGVGLIITEHSLCTQPHGRKRRNVVFDSDWNLLEMKDLADAVHAYGARIVVQLSIGHGRQEWPGKNTLSLEAPSPVPFIVREGSAPAILKDLEGIKGPMPKEIEPSRIEELVESFGQATERIRKAGFDGIEIHAAHGYLLAEFLSPLSIVNDLNKFT